MSFTYADLFAGIGGFAAALNGFGGRHVYSVEIDHAAAEVYRRNWGHNPLGDVTSDAPEGAFAPAQWSGQDHPIDVLVGGFPCQPFSKSGAQRGMDEVRGTLFFNVMQIIEAKRPTVVVLENVRNLVGPRHAHEWQLIKELLHAAGYQVSEDPAIISPHQIDPAYGGTPQVRERVFITGTLVPDGDVRDPRVEPVSVPDRARMHREWDLIDDLLIPDELEQPGLELSADEAIWINHWEEWVQVVREYRARDALITNEPPRRLPGFPIWANVWTTSIAQRDALMHPDGVRVPSWKAAFLNKNWELYDSLHGRDPKWLNRWLSITRSFPESRQKLEWQAQDASSLWDCVISLRPSGIRAKRMTHLPALVAITQTPILGPRKRRLSPREAARLQGLPDAFDFGDQRDTSTYRQLGNGVNTGVVWNVLKAHVERDAYLLNQTATGKGILHAVRSAPDDPQDAIADALLARPGSREPVHSPV